MSHNYEFQLFEKDFEYDQIDYRNVDPEKVSRYYDDLP